MSVRKVFVIWTNPLFRESVRLLLSHPDIIWVGAASEITTAQADIVRLHPDTILFEKTSAHFPIDLLNILEVEDMRLIGLSLDDNFMSLFHHERQIVVQAGDLLQIVLG